MPSLRLLVADDAVEFRKSVRLTLMLERDFDVVGVARDGHEALELAFQFQPDAALVDIHMPKMDGVNVIRGIAKVSPLTGCVVISSDGQPEMVRQAMEAGALGYLVKPYNAEELIMVLRRAATPSLNRRALRAEAAHSAEQDQREQLERQVLMHLRVGRMDDEAAKVYAAYALRPTPPPDLSLLARLAEIFCARREWHTLRKICERLEMLTKDAT